VALEQQRVALVVVPSRMRGRMKRRRRRTHHQRIGVLASTHQRASQQLELVHHRPCAHLDRRGAAAGTEVVLHVARCTNPQPHNSTPSSRGRLSSARRVSWRVMGSAALARTTTV
jgi:hypothetical protein